MESFKALEIKSHPHPWYCNSLSASVISPWFWYLWYILSALCILALNNFDTCKMAKKRKKEVWFYSRFSFTKYLGGYLVSKLGICKFCFLLRDNSLPSEGTHIQHCFSKEFLATKSMKPTSFSFSFNLEILSAGFDFWHSWGLLWFWESLLE